MPGLPCSGLSAAITGSVPVIMVTARLGEVDKVVGLAAGCRRLRPPKPFNHRELVARIRPCCSVVKKVDLVPEVVEAAGVRMDVDAS